MSIKVSVIVPVYKVEQFIKKCLDSLLSQTLRDIEIICVNDGSPDRCDKILEEYAKKDSRIVVINQENQGLSCSRNNGLRIAKGEYIGFVDSDDWVSPDFFENLYNSAKKYDCDIACTNIVKCGKIIKKYKLQYKKEEVFTTFEEKVEATQVPALNYVWNKIYKRESLLESKISFPQGKNYEDIHWTPQVLYSLKSLVTVPDAKYFYRIRKGSIVKTKSLKNEQDAQIATEAMLDFFKSKNSTTALKNYVVNKTKLKFLGLKVLKIKTFYPDRKKYTLLGFVKLSQTKGEQLEKLLLK